MARRLLDTIDPQKLAHMAGQDEGNRRMRAAGRTAWNEDDYDAAVEECERVARLKGLVPPV